MDWGLALALGLSLSLDAFAVSCAIPFAVPQISWPQALRVAGTFGIFQALMPLAGWMAADLAADLIAPVDHWVAFGLLSLVGGRMIGEGWAKMRSPGRCQTLSGDPTRGRRLLALAVGTSIDALAVGVSFIGLRIAVYRTVAVIGMVTFLTCMAGLLASKRLCGEGGGRWEIAGGGVLVAMGIKILGDHLGFF